MITDNARPRVIGAVPASLLADGMSIYEHDRYAPHLPFVNQLGGGVPLLMRSPLTGRDARAQGARHFRRKWMRG